MTIDSNIQTHRFLDSGGYGLWGQSQNVLSLSGNRLLEVKYSDYMPNWLQQALMGLSSTMTSFSKYANGIKSEFGREKVDLEDSRLLGVMHGFS